MFVKLPDPVVTGKKKFDGVHVLLNHVHENIICANGNISPHQTKIIIKTENAVICKAEAKCSEFDVFRKSEGRKCALSRALSQDVEHVLSRNNRRVLWEMFCPTIGKKNKRIKKIPTEK